MTVRMIAPSSLPALRPLPRFAGEASQRPGPFPEGLPPELSLEAFDTRLAAYWGEERRDEFLAAMRAMSPEAQAEYYKTQVVGMAARAPLPTAMREVTEDFATTPLWEIMEGYPSIYGIPQPPPDAPPAERSAWIRLADLFRDTARAMLKLEPDSP